MQGWYSYLFPNIYLGAGNGAKTQKKLAQHKNEDTWINCFSYNTLIALNNRYKINGFLDTMNERVFMQSMLWYGYTFIVEIEGNLIVLPGCPDGSGINVNGDYGGAWVYGCNGFNKNVKLFIPGSNKSAFLAKTISGIKDNRAARGVMIRENQEMTPFMRYVIQYTTYEADTLRTLDVARLHLKHPYVITCQQSMIETVKGWLNTTKNNEETYISTGIFPADKIQIQDLNTPPAITQSVTSLYEWYDNQFKGKCWMKHNAQADKKGENLVSDEVNIDTEANEETKEKALDYLQKELDVANDVFSEYGLNLTLEEDENDTDKIYDELEGQRDFSDGSK